MLVEALWWGGVALAAQFLYVGLRLRPDRSYAWFGLVLAAGSLVFLPVSGLLPTMSPADAEAWWRLGHLSAFFSLPLLAVFLVRAGFLNLGRLEAGERTGPRGERFRRSLLIVGGLLLGAGGLADAAQVPGPCYSFLGFAAFAAAADYALMSRFLEVRRETRETMDRLSSAYAELRENAGLRELGASAAMISHEIRNYVSTLKGNAVLMERALHAEGGVHADAIRNVALRMEEVSRDIAVFATSSGPISGNTLSLEALIHSFIARHFPSRQESFHVEAQGPTEVLGDEGKLEQVFLNLARNAFQAGAQRIEIRMLPWRDRLILAFEDDGEGCSPEEVPRISTPFYTGRQGKGGTGLGCSIVASLLKSHGASFRMYSKNALGSGRRGMLINAVFPRAAPAEEPGAEVVVVADTPESRGCILPALLNLGLRPALVSGTDPAPGLPDSLHRPVFLAEAGGLGTIRTTWGRRPIYVVDPSRVARRDGAGPGGDAPFPLSEENLARLLTAEGHPPERSSAEPAAPGRP